MSVLGHAIKVVAVSIRERVMKVIGLGKSELALVVMLLVEGVVSLRLFGPLVELVFQMHGNNLRCLSSFI